MSKEIRFEIEVDGRKGFLAPLTFPVAEAALGFVLAPRPKYLTAGGIIINSLWVRGSKTLKEGGENYDGACMQAYATINGIDYEYKDGVITVPFKGKNYTCKLKENIDRETLEDCLGLIMPTQGNPRPLTAGKRILNENWESGDKEIKDNPELLVAACLACYHIVNVKTSSIKKV